ncbi:MAG: hypothetical protein KME07_04405 [Pegethrix bostrychoides GSE-TBD4-15B]|jgi:hypothetical protein|uniref:Uncharacterized protein n=1 Tax=Pegethrix bostrychoides GSE-TBD4-15B TaxID=2839662 RepID=A0A951P810_9CYAN|nr:hypothetical protein [Pegethrix bostrychoides GSE-TBD4-15B]
MSTKREWLYRSRWLITKAVLFTSGVLLGFPLGWIVGAIVFFGLTQTVSDCNWINFLRSFSIISRGNACEITHDELSLAFGFFTTWGEFLGIGFLTWKLGEAHQLFYYLLNLKAVHRMTFIRVRKYVHEPNNFFADAVFSLIYVFASTCIPLVLAFTAGWIMFLMFFHVLSWISLIAVICGSFYVWLWGVECVYMLLYPHRIEKELKQAHLYISAIEAFEQEQLKRKRLLQGGKP